MIAYNIKRDGKIVAHAVTLPNGRCVVSWPTSTIVYDSEMAARRVHIDHMGGRGEDTSFEFYCAPKAVERGWLEAYQDRCEGVPMHAVNWSLPSRPVICAPDYIPEDERGDWIEGYAALLSSLYGTEWRETCRPVEPAPTVEGEVAGEESR